MAAGVAERIDLADFFARGVEVVSMRNKANRLEELFMRLVESGAAATGRPA